MTQDIDRLVQRIIQCRDRKITRIGYDIVGKLEGSLFVKCPVPKGSDNKYDADELLEWIGGVRDGKIKTVELHEPEPLGDDKCDALGLRLDKRDMAALRSVEPKIRTVADVKELVIACDGDLTQIDGIGEARAQNIHERLSQHDKATPGHDPEWRNRVAQHLAARDSKRFADPGVTAQPEQSNG